MDHYTELTLLCEKIANRSDFPARITDWANDLYQLMIDKNAAIEAYDLILLQDFEVDESRALYNLDHYLACNNSHHNDDSYNGWTNRETWIVNLWWMQDNKNMADYWLTVAKTCDNNDQLATLMKESLLTIAEKTGLLADILHCAISKVNFQEIADYVMVQVKEELALELEQ